MNYYEVHSDDAQYPDSWFLNEPRTVEGGELDPREFRYGTPYNGPRPAVVSVKKDGQRTAFHLGAFDMPVVTTEIADILENLAPGDIERYPVRVGDGITNYEIINIILQKACVDERRSGVMKWGPHDNRPDKIGQYRQLLPLFIDASRTDDSHIFRICGSLVEMIVSEKVKFALQGIDDLGIVFQPIT